MSQISFIPVPYYQFIVNAANFNLSTLSFETVPNKKIHRHCPFIIIDADYINEPLMDVAIAASDDEASEPAPDNFSEDSSYDNGAHENNVHENIAHENNSHENTISTNPNSDSEKPINSSDSHSSNDKSNNNSNSNQHQTKDSTSSHVDSEKPLTAKEKDRLDYLAKLKADPANAKLNGNKSKENTSENVAKKQQKQLDNNQENKNKLDNNSEKITVVSNTTESLENSDNKDDNNASVNTNSKNNSNTQKQSESEKSSDTSPSTDNSLSNSHKSEAEKDIKTAKKKEKNDNKDDKEELSEEEKQKVEKEAKLESYKQFVAEQKSKIDIDYQGIRVDIEANALPNRLYFIMNALSAIIASYGLVINSAAVVIGAMLVAMMLGPISGVALAIIDYRMPFLRKSLFTVVAGASMVVFIGYLVGFLHQDSSLTNEILSRTQPTSMDLMIALAGGTAGAYAMISPHLSVAVVGVAVATALVPPLAASGILFAHGEGTLGLGALLLALTNIIAIQFTNALVLWFSGFRRLVEDDYKSSTFIAFFRRNAVPILLLIGIGVYLTYNFNTIRKKQLFENEVKESINDYFIDKGNAVSTTQFLPREDYQTVRAVMRGETRPTPNDAKYLEQKINETIQQKYSKFQPVRIQLRYIPVVVIESNPFQTDEINKTDAAILTNE